MKVLLNKLIIDETMRQFVGFILIGVVNTIFGFAMYALLVLVGVPPQPALAIAFIIGVIWNFWTHARFVFDNTGLGKLPAYALCYVAVYAFNSFTLGLALSNGIGPLLAQAILAPFAAVLSFFLISRVLTGRFPLFGGKP